MVVDYDYIRHSSRKYYKFIKNSNIRQIFQKQMFFISLFNSITVIVKHFYMILCVRDSAHFYYINL